MTNNTGGELIDEDTTSKKRGGVKESKDFACKTMASYQCGTCELSTECNLIQWWCVCASGSRMCSRLMRLSRWKRIEGRANHW